MNGESFPLLDCPWEIQLFIFSFLPTADLNSLRTSCLQLQQFVDGNQNNLYRRQVPILVGKRSAEAFRLKISFHRHYFLLGFSTEQYKCNSVEGFTVEPHAPNFFFSDEEYTTLLVEEFMGQTVENCIEAITERSQGFGPFTVGGHLTPDLLLFLVPFMDYIKDLVFLCTIDDSIPGDDPLLRQLITVKHQLHLCEQILSGRQDFIDDAFCRNAGSKVLELKAKTIWLTNTQLMSLVEREDLEQLKVDCAAGVTLPCIRASIQFLLKSGPRFCAFAFNSTAYDLFDDIWTAFEVQLEDEDIIARRWRDKVEFTYEKDGGMVVMTTAGHGNYVMICKQ